MPPHYDSLVAKLIVHGRSRNECLMRLRRALEEFVIGGIETIDPGASPHHGRRRFPQRRYDIRWLEKFVAEQQS